MSKEDLIPLGQNPEYDKEVRSKLKGSSSQKRKDAQQLRRLREMSPEEQEKRALQLATDPKTTALEIMKMIVVLKDNKQLKPETEIQLIRALSDAYSKVFGSKSFNVNVNTSLDNYTKRIKKRLEEKYEIVVEENDKNNKSTT